MSGFFSSQTPVLSPRDSRSAKRKPLHERSSSRNNQRETAKSPERRTVRLIKQSPSPSPTRKYDGKEILGKENVVVGQRGLDPGLSAQPKLVEEHSGFLSADKDVSVSDKSTSTNETPGPDDQPRVDVQPKVVHLTNFAKGWHRRSVSSGKYSDSSTLRDSDFAFAQQIDRNDRLSQGTTLRGTPTSHEHELRARIDAEDTAAQGPAQALATLQEVPQDSSTVRAVPPSTSSSTSSGNLDIVTVVSEDSSARPYSSHSDSEAAPSPAIPRQRLRRAASTGSAQHFTSSPILTGSSGPPSVRQQTSQESIPRSDTNLSLSSSPNIVTYSVESLRPRSGTHPLHYATSYESIDSRLQYPTTIRPNTGRSLATSSSWASLQSSDDALPPLQVPKKRLRHKAGSKSLGAQASASYTSGAMSYEEIDTQPYPRQVFSSHLSTIASESDRTGSQHLSHFSIGSGVLTGDDASSMPLSGTWPRSRRDSVPPISSSSDAAYHTMRNSGEEPGDMTLGIFREESAKPEPLFRLEAAPELSPSRRYDGPLPPMPPIPKSRDSDEDFDTLTALQAPPLRQKRSGYSIRQRSNSMPSATHSRQQSMVSYIESDRWSHGSSIFPTWAKHFYAGAAILTSKTSLVSLRSNNSQVQLRPGNHERSRSWTQRSVNGRLGTGYSEQEPGSPASSHFLPSIFRTRTRPRTSTDSKRYSVGKLRKQKPSPLTDQRADSIAMRDDPEHAQEEAEDEILPSGQPRWGRLRDESDRTAEAHPPPLPRKYSTQKRWNQMQFPRPMSKDRLRGSDFTPFAPHLAPTARSRGHNSAWRPPSFVESLDTLLHSPCNRQMLLFTLGFLCPLLWMVGAALPLPHEPPSVTSAATEKSQVAGSEEDVRAAMMDHEAGDAERRWRDEQTYLRTEWWRTLNRIMSIVGLLVIAAVVS